MPSFTKQAIMDAFLRLMERKPLDKITVRDLVDTCGINRNTFYYYFQDIYAVLEEFCNEAVGTLPQNASFSDTVAALLSLSANFYHDHPRAAKTLAFSLGAEGLDRYFGVRFEPFLAACIEKGHGAPTPLSLLHFVRHAIIGLCLDIMRGEKYTAQVLPELLPFLETRDASSQTT